MKLTELIDKVDPSIESKIREAKKTNLQAFRMALSSSMRLATSAAKRSHTIQVDIVPGYPTVLKDMEFPDFNEQAEHLISVRRNLECYLQDSKAIAAAILSLPVDPRSSSSKREGFLEALSSGEVVVRKLLQFSVKQSILRNVLEVDKDILGTYSFEKDKGRIRLYWAVIGLVSSSLGVSPVNLAMVVLVHELAHAYTHLGADADGHTWPQMFKQDRRILEGLAQYYTHVVLHEINLRGMESGIQRAYNELTVQQPETYQRHLLWVKQWQPEVVRASMLEARNAGFSNRGAFEAALEEQAKRLKVAGHLY